MVNMKINSYTRSQHNERLEEFDKLFDEVDRYPITDKLFLVKENDCRYTVVMNSNPGGVISSVWSSKKFGRRTAIMIVRLTSPNHGFISDEELMKGLWVEADYFSIRCKDVYVSNIRNFLQPDSSIKIVRTTNPVEDSNNKFKTHGKGYRSIRYSS